MDKKLRDRQFDWFCRAAYDLGDLTLMMCYDALATD